MKFLRITLPLLGLFIAGRTMAQSFAVSESSSTLNGPRHILLANPEGDYVTVTYPFEDEKGPVGVSRFDRNTMRQTYSTSLNEFNNEHLRSALYSDGRLFLISSNNSGAVNRWEINDKTGAVSGSPSLIFNLEAKERTDGIHDAFVPLPTYFTASSANRNFNCLVVEEIPRKEKGRLLHGVIFDRQMNTLATFSFLTPEDLSHMGRLAPDLLLSDGGDLSMIYAVKVKPAKDDYTPLVYSVVQVNKKGKTDHFQVAGLPSGSLQNISWRRQDNGLTFTGWLAPGKNDDFKSIVSGRLPDGQAKVSDLHSWEIGSLTGQLPDYLRKTLEKDGLSIDATLRYSFELPGGGRALALEVQDDEDRTEVTTFSDGSRMHMGYNTRTRGDVYLLQLDKEGKPLLMNVITKRETDPDMAIEAGLVCTMGDQGQIYIFFYDKAKNTDVMTKRPAVALGKDYKSNELACVSVAPDGSMKKQFIPLEDHEFRMMPEKAVSLHNNEFVFTRLHQKASFSPAGVFNHGTFRFGVIRIK